MEISEKNTVQINPYVNQVLQNKTSPQSADVKKQTNPGDDSVDLSQNVKDLKLAQAALTELPDTRSELVARLKKKIDDGTYEIEPDKIAGKMIKESLLNKLP